LPLFFFDAVADAWPPSARARLAPTSIVKANAVAIDMARTR
jgi:hypothetical protein